MRILLLVAAACLALASSIVSAETRRPEMKTLNTVVTELLNVKPHGSQELSFTNPRDGWVFVQVKGNGKGLVRISIDSIPDVITHRGADPSTLEAMRSLSRGRHTINIHCEGKASLDTLVVRSIPELYYCQYPADPHVSAYGKYDWAFLSKYVLPNVNCIVASDYVTEKHIAEVKEWKARGGRWIFPASVPGDKNDPTPIADQSYNYWHEHPGFKHPMIDGIIIDEFTFGPDDPRYEAWSEALDRIYKDPKCKGKSFYAWTAGTPMYEGPRSTAFSKHVMDYGGKIAAELYLAETPTEAEADSAFHWMRDELTAWNKAIPGASSHFIATLGYMSQPTESLNIDPTIDFKVFLDRQMHTIANDPAFSGLSGIMYYLSPYTDEETVRWGGRLLRHYCIEGRKDMLSDRYGFKYHLDHVRNPDFDEGLAGWDISPAEEGAVTTGHLEGWSWLEGRYPRTPRGDNFLLARRSAKKPNVFSQEIRNLKPGKLYCMKMFTGDYQDILNERSVQHERHAVSIRIDNADLVPERCFDQPMPNCYAHHLGKFNDVYKAYMVYHWRVFRAKGTTAKLSISDWDSAKKPGGPIGQELMYNFIEVQPYYLE